VKLGDKYFWLRSYQGLALILFLSIIPTATIAFLIGNTSDYMAVGCGLLIANLRVLAWRYWGDGR